MKVPAPARMKPTASVRRARDPSAMHPSTAVEVEQSEGGVWGEGGERGRGGNHKRAWAVNNRALQT